MSCSHCGVAANHAGRGLCKRCYNNRSVRVRYPCTLEIANTNQAPATLPEPTDALPGTPEKVRVLARRMQLGQQLYHPLDNLGHVDLSSSAIAVMMIPDVAPPPAEDHSNGTEEHE